eukprot:7853880-Ditylum_brightwellii.AAC.1
MAYKREIVIYITPKRRMNEIFHVKGLEACTQDRGCLTYTCATKVSFVNGAGQNIIGYVLDEDDKHFSH